MHCKNKQYNSQGINVAPYADSPVNHAQILVIYPNGVRAVYDPTQSRRLITRDSTTANLWFRGYFTDTSGIDMPTRSKTYPNGTWGPLDATARLSLPATMRSSSTSIRVQHTKTGATIRSHVGESNLLFNANRSDWENLDGVEGFAYQEVGNRFRW